MLIFRQILNFTNRYDKIRLNDKSIIIISCFSVKGTVKYISPSSFNSEQMGSVYLVKLEITDVPDGINVVSGLSGSVEIKTDKRTVMEYFLDSIMKGFGESLKEK